MNLEWKRDGFTHYCYNKDNGRVMAKLSHTITNGHYSATIIPITGPYEPYGEWKDIQSAINAVVFELQLKEEK